VAHKHFISLDLALGYRMLLTTDLKLVKPIVYLLNIQYIILRYILYIIYYIL